MCTAHAETLHDSHTPSGNFSPDLWPQILRSQRKRARYWRDRHQRHYEIEEYLSAGNLAIAQYLQHTTTPDVDEVERAMAWAMRRVPYTQRPYGTKKGDTWYQARTKSAVGKKAQERVGLWPPRPFAGYIVHDLLRLRKILHILQELGEPGDCALQHWIYGTSAKELARQRGYHAKTVYNWIWQSRKYLHATLIED